MNDLRRISAKEDIPQATIEKDYAITVALNEIAKTDLAKKIVFKGGTAIKKVYFEKARFSEDLDFSVIKPLTKKEIISQLENKKVNYILLSNRIDAKEQGLGTFGKTYCLILAKYIGENFEVVATFGDWQNDPGWAWNHGTKILKRIKPL